MTEILVALLPASMTQRFLFDTRGGGGGGETWHDHIVIIGVFCLFAYFVFLLSHSTLVKN